MRPLSPERRAPCSRFGGDPRRRGGGVSAAFPPPPAPRGARRSSSGREAISRARSPSGGRSQSRGRAVVTPPASALPGDRARRGDFQPSPERDAARRLPPWNGVAAGRVPSPHLTQALPGRIPPGAHPRSLISGEESGAAVFAVGARAASEERASEPQLCLQDTPSAWKTSARLITPTPPCSAEIETLSPMTPRGHQ
ncbi:uncharacterized protein LOC144580584 [Callithrix jacchus]